MIQFSDLITYPNSRQPSRCYLAQKISGYLTTLFQLKNACAKKLVRIRKNVKKTDGQPSFDIPAETDEKYKKASAMTASTLQKFKQLCSVTIEVVVSCVLAKQYRVIIWENYSFVCYVTL
jgi:hypothetical protein